MRNSAPKRSPRLAVILVNWRNAPDTIACLSSLRDSSEPLHAIVCDNGSQDGSVEAILDWAATESQPMAHYRPGESGPAPDGPATTFTLIETGANLGYAGGNNAGLRFALRNPETSHFWLLNNDTTVEPGAAGAILAAFDARPELGMVGTQLRLHHQPDRFQMQGMMRFEAWSGRSFGIGAGRPVAAPLPAAEVERVADFVCGASMTVSRDWLERVGLLEERYFLYYEEIDWALRNRGRFALGYCPEAIVWHKEGASAGSSNSGAQRSPFSDYHHARSQRIFARLHHPLLLPLYAARAALQAVRRLAQGRRDKAGAILRGWLGRPFVTPAASGK